MFFALVRFIYDGGTLVLPVLLVVAAWRRRRGSLLALAVGLVALRIYATHVEPRRLQVHHVTHAIGGPTLRIAHLSDIQSDAIGEWEARVLDEVTAEKPQLVIHTGDLLHPIAPATVESELPKIATLLGRLAPTPMLTVEGDTDGWMVEGERTEVAGMTLLVDRGISLSLAGREIAVLGLSLFRSAGGARGFIADWAHAQNDGALRVVIGHRPDFALELEGLPVDIALAGHTHGGQIRIPGFGPLLILSDVPRDWARGHRVIHGSTLLNVSAGIGAEHAADLPSIRFFCPPELTMIDLR